jgi:hypothetical protein
MTEPTNPSSGKPVTTEELRQLALKRIKDKYDFRVHLIVYLAVNALLVSSWAVTGNLLTLKEGEQLTFFWPIFVIVGWGIGLVVHWYSVYFAPTYSEDQIQREMRKLMR